jgi:O-antigen/teichoic acid export membrane protein
VLLNFLLIPPFGIVGAACATLAGFFCQFVCCWGWALASGPFWRDLRHAMKVILAAACMAAGVGLLDPIVAGPAVMHLKAMMAIGVALYGALALLFGIAPAAWTTPVRARLASVLKPR